MRIGGWKRIGIVASVVWMIGGTIAGHLYEVSVLDERSMSSFRLCYESRTQGTNYDGAAALRICSQQSQERRVEAFNGIWVDDIFVALVPVFLGWPAVFALRGMFRWVKRGFGKPEAAVKHAMTVADCGRQRNGCEGGTPG